MKISPSKKGIPSYPVLMKAIGLAAAAVSLVSCDKAERKRQLGGLIENQQVTRQNETETSLPGAPLPPSVPQENARHARSVTTLPGAPLPPSEPERPPQATAGEVPPERTDALSPEEEPLQLGGDVPYVPENNEDDE